MNEQHTDTVEAPSAEADPFSSNGTRPWCPSSRLAHRREAPHVA
ncbi:MAG: hypothetical protein AAGU26_11085 [bacterium]|jgi:hypothetical protein|nr:hypothetical protein [Spirochaetales bacterium]